LFCTFLVKIRRAKVCKFEAFTHYKMGTKWVPTTKNL
jgi:hypothetical protein